MYDFFSTLAKKILKTYKMMKFTQSDMENWGLRGKELVKVTAFTLEMSPFILKVKFLIKTAVRLNLLSVP